MITFKHRSNSKRINIRTSKKLDQRMSGWLQKVFGIRNQIIGFKSAQNKYYEADTFYMLIDKFYNSQVEIVQGNDQVEISFTSDNLNSSSFIRPSQPNTQDINQRGSFQDEGILTVADKGAFERKLADNKEFSVLFDIHPSFKKEITDSSGQITNPFPGIKVNLYLLLNNNPPKKSTYSIYFGKTCIVTIPLTDKYKKFILNAVSKARSLNGAATEQNKAVKRHDQQDEAPSFTTYHLQQRLNQQACMDYLNRMSRQKLLSNYQYHKLVEKLEDNFNEFYKIFCEGVMDNDFQSFKHQIKTKVQNNLEMLLSNVEEMDLSRPISREEQRRLNLRKSVPDIQIVKVQNYFEVLDLIKDRIDPKYLGEIKQNLLDENQQLCSHFSKFLSRQIGKEELSRKIITFACERVEDLRPFSRCIPRNNNRAKSSEYVQKGSNQDEQQEDILEPRSEEAPMFGLLSIPQNENVSPIKNMSDIQSNYKRAEEQLTKKINYFAPEEYGLLYHYLQTRDDGISNLIQELDENQEETLEKLKEFLNERLSQILIENFNQSQLSYLESLKSNPAFSYIFENFKYDCDLNIFLSTLREEVSKGKPQVQRILHKKSSDSQLLDHKNGKQSQKRKYSVQKQENQNQEQQGSPSPKASESKISVILVSLYQKGSQFSLYHIRSLSCPWMEQFEQLLAFCQFQQKQKEQYLRISYQECNPSLFLWVREYLKNKQTGAHDAEYFRQRIQKKQYEQKNIIKILPLFNQLMRQFENEGKITNKMRKWAVFSFVQLSLPLIAAFELYLLESNVCFYSEDEEELIDSLKLAFENQNKEMEFFKIYMSRIEQILKEIVGHDQASVELFKYYPDLIRSFIQIFYFNGDFEELMDSLDILQARHRANCCINVATLNFSGINTNPFEYDDGSEIFTSLNQNIKELIQKEIPDLTDWKVGKIDKNYTSSDRLSVGFNSKIDTKDGKLLNKEQFNEIWRSKWEVSQTRKSFAATEEEISTAIHMDYIFYRAVLKQVYGCSTYEQLDQKLKQLDPSKLALFLQQKFDRPASKIGVKADWVYEYLLRKKIDLLCLQQAGFVDWGEQLIKEYGQLKHHDSVLIYRKEKLGHIRPDLMEKYGKDLDFNNDTAFIFTDRHYLLISAHLKSSKLHIEQAKSMFQTLRRIKQQRPLLKIIIGMDANHLVKYENLLNQKGQQMFFLTPSTQQKPTSIKKRSFMQAQFKKAGLSVSEVKDHIVASRQIDEAVIERIDGEESKNQLLPNDIHPYDHYVIRGIIKFG